jgi:enamine deaminase RidA (YjgF/YER057c/UK114 family)
MPLYPGTPYDYSRSSGDLIFTAGACPLDESGRILAPGDFVAQAARAAENLIEALALQGATTDDLVKTTVYVLSDQRSDLVEVWKVVTPLLGRAPSTLLGVSMLGYDGQLVEIEAIARRPMPPR